MKQFTYTENINNYLPIALARTQSNTSLTNQTLLKEGSEQSTTIDL